VLLRKEATDFITNTDTELRSIVAGRWNPRTSRSQATPKGTGDGKRVAIFVRKWSFRREHVSDVAERTSDVTQWGKPMLFSESHSTAERIRGRG
jgi:hypothetical protein